MYNCGTYSLCSIFLGNQACNRMRHFRGGTSQCEQLGICTSPYTLLRRTLQGTLSRHQIYFDIYLMLVGSLKATLCFLVSLNEHNLETT